MSRKNADAEVVRWLDDWEKASAQKYLLNPLRYFKLPYFLTGVVDVGLVAYQSLTCKRAFVWINLARLFNSNVHDQMLRARDVKYRGNIAHTSL